MEPTMAVWPVLLGVQPRVQVAELPAGHVERELERVVLELVAMPMPG
jgi:hypothetical protein